MNTIEKKDRANLLLLLSVMWTDWLKKILGTGTCISFWGWLGLFPCLHQPPSCCPFSLSAELHQRLIRSWWGCQLREVGVTSPLFVVSTRIQLVIFLEAPAPRGGGAVSLPHRIGYTLDPSSGSSLRGWTNSWVLITHNCGCENCTSGCRQVSRNEPSRIAGF